MDEPYQLDANTKWQITLYKNSVGASHDSEVGVFKNCTEVTVGVAVIKFTCQKKVYITSLGYLIQEE